MKEMAKRKSWPLVLWRLALANPKPTKNEIAREGGGGGGYETVDTETWIQAVFNKQKVLGFCGV